jgi:hypothetical protein
MRPGLRERGRKALHQWQHLLSEMVKAGIKRKEIRKGVHPKKLVTLIVGSLEGALMISRLERDREALLETQLHLERYLDTEVRLRPRGRKGAGSRRSLATSVRSSSRSQGSKSIKAF